jgi:hypothetical protein
LGSPSRDFHFIESYQFKCEETKIRWILMVSSLNGLRSWIPVPLFAGDLTSPTGGAFRRIYEKGFICHLSHLLNSSSVFWLAQRAAVSLAS